MKRIIMFTIIFGFTLALSSCLKISKIEDNYIDAGYTYSNDSSDIAESLSLIAALNTEGVKTKIYVFTKPSRIAIVIEFDDKDEIQSSLEDINVIKNLVAGYDVDDITKKQFLVIPIATTEEGEQEIIDIFQD